MIFISYSFTAETLSTMKPSIFLPYLTTFCIFFYIIRNQMLIFAATNTKISDK